MSEAVICLVPTEEKANQIYLALQASGFTSSDISVLMPDKNYTRDLGHEKHSKAPEGIAAGSSTGAIVGGTLGWLAGIGSLAIPGLGAFIAAGPIMAMLGGAAVGGAVGGTAGGLLGLGLPEYEAKQYEGKLREGNILLSVHTTSGEQIKKAEKVFKDFGAQNIMMTNEAKVKR